MAVTAWWQTAFGRHYPLAYAHRDQSEADAQVQALLPLLRGLPGPLLDVGCGGGRHLRALRRSGVPACGVDYSADLLALQEPGSIVRGDMRRLPLAGGCWGGVTLFFTAFGYFDDAGNAACLAHLATLPAPGGLLIIDVPLPSTLDALVERSERILADGSRLIEVRRRDGHRVRKDAELHGPHGIARWSESVAVHDEAWWSHQARRLGLAPVPAPPGSAPAGRTCRIFKVSGSA